MAFWSQGTSRTVSTDRLTQVKFLPWMYATIKSSFFILLIFLKNKSKNGFWYFLAQKINLSNLWIFNFYSLNVLNEPLAMTEFGIYFGVGRIHMPLGYYTMQWMNQGPPSLILLICDVITRIRHFLVTFVTSSSDKRLIELASINAAGLDMNWKSW